MTKTFLKQVNVTDFTKQTTNAKVSHEALSSYIVANYLFENIDNRIKFFDDINRQFSNYLRTNAVNFYLTITTTLTESQVITLLETNIKLVYKGGNMINFYLATYRRLFAQLNVQIDLDTLSDFDFNILINYDDILNTIKIPLSNENYLKLSRFADLVAFNIINHFNNYLFCFQESIVKKSIVSFSTTYPNTSYYKLGESSPAHIQTIFAYARNYFDQLIQAPSNPNIIEFIGTNIDNLINKEYNHNLELLFDIIKQCTRTEIEFIGFALPTTFNKHKQIFPELASITTDNSMKLTSFVNKLFNNINSQAPTMLSASTDRTGKIRLGTKLVNLDKRYDRIKTNITDIFPSNTSGDYSQFLPLNVLGMIVNQTNNTNDLIARYMDSSANELGFNNFYSMQSDRLILTESIDYDKFISSNVLAPINYTDLFSNTFHQSYEDMVSISINHSILFGTKNATGNWTKLTNFNLVRGKIPIRYYLKLSNPIEINGNQIEYLFVDYLGELIDMSIPTYADTNLKHHQGGDFTNIFKSVNIRGTTPLATVSINTYTEAYLISDLYVVLFETGSGKPWEVPKYEKRIARVIKLYLSYLKYNYSTIQRVNMYNYFVCLITKVQDQFNETGTININLIINPTEPLDDIFVNFLTRLEMLASILQPVDRLNASIFIQLVLCYLQFSSQCKQQFPNVQNFKPIEFLSLRMI